MHDFFESEWEEKLAKVITCIRSAPEMQSILHVRRRKIQREYAAIARQHHAVFRYRLGHRKHGIKRTRYRMSPEQRLELSIKRRKENEARFELAQKLIGLVVRINRPQSEPEIKPERSRRQSAPKRECRCVNILDHFLYCDFSFLPFFKKRKVLQRMAA